MDIVENDNAGNDFRREEILDASFRTLEKYGLAAVSYDLIAEEAGCSRQLLRRRYPDAEILMVGIVETVFEQFYGLVMGNISEQKITHRLPIYMDFFLQSASLEDGPPSSTFDSLFALTAGSEAVREAMRNAHQILVDIFATELLMDHPELELQKRSELGYLFVCLSTGYWRMMSSLDFPEQFSTSARSAMQSIIDSYVAESLEYRGVQDCD